jgi:hypothetical protein
MPTISTWILAVTTLASGLLAATAWTRVLFVTATIVSAQHWTADAYVLGLATLGYGMALTGYDARRYRLLPWMQCLVSHWWVIRHLTGMISWSVALCAALYVENAVPVLAQELPIITFGVAPAIMAIPFLVPSREVLPTRHPSCSDTEQAPRAVATARTHDTANCRGG